MFSGPCWNIRPRQLLLTFLKWLPLSPSISLLYTRSTCNSRIASASNQLIALRMDMFVSSFPPPPATEEGVETYFILYLYCGVSIVPSSTGRVACVCMRCKTKPNSDFWREWSYLKSISYCWLRLLRMTSRNMFFQTSELWRRKFVAMTDINY